MVMYALVPVIAALIAGSHPSVKAATSDPTAPVTSNDGKPLVLGLVFFHFLGNFLCKLVGFKIVLREAPCRVT